MKAYGGVWVQLYIRVILTLELYENEWPTSWLGLFTIGDVAYSDHWIRNRVFAKAGVTKN